MNGYSKFASQLVATVLAAVVPALLGDNYVDTGEAINIVILALGSVAVLGAGNLPSGVWSYAKLWVSAATAVATLLSSVYTDGLTTSEIIQLVLAGLGALGVYAVRGPVVTAARGGAQPAA